MHQCLQLLQFGSGQYYRLHPAPGADGARILQPECQLVTAPRLAAPEGFRIIRREQAGQVRTDSTRAECSEALTQQSVATAAFC